MNHALTALQMLLAGIVTTSLLANLLFHFSVRRKLRARTRRRSAFAPAFAPAISVLKPLCGADEGLYENLRSLLTQHYPEFELLLGVSDPFDPAIAPVLRLLRDFPNAPVRVVVRPADAGVLNPKVGNLINIERLARYDYLLISDSNVYVEADYLASIAAEMEDPQVGLVSNVIVGRDEGSLGARLESLQLNTFVLGGVCTADLHGDPCVVGKSMLMRRSAFDAVGGFAAVTDVLAEDYMLGLRFAEAGHRVVLSSHPVEARHPRISVGRFMARHLRWAQLRRWAAPRHFPLEPLLFTTPWLLLVLAATRGTAGASSMMALLGTVALLRLTSDAWLLRLVTGRPVALRSLALVPLRDCLSLAFWCLANLQRSVTWRGHALRIGQGTRLSRAPGVRPAQEAVATS